MSLDGAKTIQFKDEDVINLRGFGIDEVVGLSAIKAHKQNLGLSLAAQDYGVDFYNKGTRIDGYIEYEGRLDSETKKRIKEAWNENYGPNGLGGTAILDNGSKYTRLGMPPEDAQFIETRKFQKNEIATILGVPPHIINDLEHATFSNIEHQGIEFVTYGLGSWIEKLEQEYGRKLLKEREKKNTYFKHNVNRLLRTDVKAKAEHYRLMSDIGVYSINDIRALEDLNPVENGDERLVQLNRIPLEQIKNYYARENNNSPSRD
jgi:HK97 family phage portal protein